MYTKSNAVHLVTWLVLQLPQNAHSCLELISSWWVHKVLGELVAVMNEELVGYTVFSETLQKGKSSAAQQQAIPPAEIHTKSHWRMKLPVETFSSRRDSLIWMSVFFSFQGICWSGNIKPYFIQASSVCINCLSPFLFCATLARFYILYKG